MRIGQKHVGRFALVKYDDVGLREELIIEVDSEAKHRAIKTFDGESVHWIDKSQLKKLGTFFSFKDTGITV
jgi:hypothetical protein